MIHKEKIELENHQLIAAISERISHLICSYTSKISPKDFTISSEIQEDNGRCHINIKLNNEKNADLSAIIGLVIGQIQGASHGMRLKPSRAKPPVFGLIYPPKAGLSAKSFEDIASALNQVIKHEIFDAHGHQRQSIRNIGLIDLGRGY